MTGEQENYDNDDALNDFVLDEGREKSSTEPLAAASDNQSKDESVDEGAAPPDGGDASQYSIDALFDEADDADFVLDDDVAADEDADIAAAVDADEVAELEAETDFEPAEPLAPELELDEAEPLAAELELDEAEPLEAVAVELTDADFDFDDDLEEVDPKEALAALEAIEADLMDDPLPAQAPAHSPVDELASDALDASAAADASEAEEEVLFSDHTQGLEPSETFAGKDQFGEGDDTTWDGDALELDSEPEAGIPVDADEGPALDLDLDLGDNRELEAQAEEFFGDVESPLQSEDDLELDSEEELEIVNEAMDLVESLGGDEDFDAVVVDGLDQATSIPEAADFLGVEEAGATEEVAWAEDAEVDEAVAGEAAPVEFLGELADSATGDAELEVEGWEPLAGTRNMDQLGEVDGCEPADGEDGDYEPEADYEWRENAADAEADHDIYTDADEDELEVVGGYRPRARVLSLLTSVAAAVLIIGGATIAVLRPQWLGLEPAVPSIDVVQLQRPQIRVAVSEPPMPMSDAPKVVTVEPTQPEPPQVAVNEPPAVPVSVPGEGPGSTTDPVATVPADPETPVPSEGGSGGDPVAGGPETTPEPQAGDPQWPVAVASPGAPAITPNEQPVLRAGDGMLLGAAEALPVRNTIDGVMPGLRAFAQLHNGNYFIGSVKAVDSEFLTLRMQEGEVSLPRDQISKLTELGSADYEQLQKATAGFVRLTNNNRLVGAILRSIADDHVVLETRRNRVMLPRSAIGEIVEGDGNRDVRLGTTKSEEDWLRRLSERQLESARPAAGFDAGTPAVPPGGSGQVK